MKTIIFIALATLALASPAKATDTWLKSYIGVWCSSGIKDIIAQERENDKCLANETAVTIFPEGYDLNEDDRCKFISIKRTGKMSAYRIAYIRTVAHCGGEGTSWTETREFSLEQVPSCTVGFSCRILSSKLLSHRR